YHLDGVDINIFGRVKNQHEQELFSLLPIKTAKTSLLFALFEILILGAACIIAISLVERPYTRIVSVEYTILIDETQYYGRYTKFIILGIVNQFLKYVVYLYMESIKLIYFYYNFYDEHICLKVSG
ncbi:hypothetical protein ACJX0J_009877, partial [Zea mays]